MTARRGALLLFTLALLGGVAGLPGRAEAAPPSKDALKRVLTSVREDDSFKVRLQAIRVLVKQLKASGTRGDDEVYAVLGEASKKDEEHLVRGLACFAIGELADPRGKPALVAAMTDPHPFVRAQAEEALKALAKAAAPAKEPATTAVPVAAGERRTVVIGVDATPGVQAVELDEALRGAIRAELEAQARERYTVGDAGGGALGFKLSGSVSERTAQATDDGATKLTIGVRITISTVPENHLRGMTNAKASAGVKVSGAALAKAEQTVLRAAVGRAVKDSLAQLAAE